MTILSKCAAAGRKESPPAWYLKLFDLESQSSSESPAFDKDIKQTGNEELSKRRLPAPTIEYKTLKKSAATTSKGNYVSKTRTILHNRKEKLTQEPDDNVSNTGSDDSSSSSSDMRPPTETFDQRFGCFFD